jgi:hypothetical protein
MTKITQEALNSILTRIPKGSLFNMEQLLNNGIVNTVLDGRIIDGGLLKEGVVLDFSDLLLDDVRIVNIKANQVSFNNTEFNNCTVLAEQAMSNCLDEAQQENIIHIQIEENSLFSQGKLLYKYDKLNPKGVCNGLCIEYARHYMKHRDQNEDINFIDKLNKKMYERSDNFIDRLESYQEKLQANRMKSTRRTEITSRDILTMKVQNKILRSMKTSSMVGLSFGGESRGHIIAINLIRDVEKNITGYKIFDPNYGEINCSMGTKEENLEKFNSQLLQLSFIYDVHNMSDKIYISDLENLVRIAGLDGKGDEKTLANKIFAISDSKIKVIPQKKKSNAHSKRSIDEFSKSAVDKLETRRVKEKASQEDKAL